MRSRCSAGRRQRRGAARDLIDELEQRGRGRSSSAAGGSSQVAAGEARLLPLRFLLTTAQPGVTTDARRASPRQPEVNFDGGTYERGINEARRRTLEPLDHVIQRYHEVARSKPRPRSAELYGPRRNAYGKSSRDRRDVQPRLRTVLPFSKVHRLPYAPWTPIPVARGHRSRRGLP